MIILTLLVPVLPGLAVTAILLRGKAGSFGFAEKLALSFVIGWALHAIIMFLISLAGVPLIFINILLADLIFAASLFALFGRQIGWQDWQPAGRGLFPLAGFVLIGLIGLKTLFVTWSAFIRPVLDPDIIRCYALGAKIIFMEKGVLTSGPWGGKPLLPFLAQAWTAIGPNNWDDSLLTLPNPLLFLCLLVIFYSALARYYKQWYALLATALLATVPFLVYQAGTAYTDFGQALFYSLASIYLFLFMKEFQRDKQASSGYLLIGTLLLGCSVWAKRSGIYYAAIDLTAVAIFLWTVKGSIEQKDRRLFGGAVVLLAAIAAPWLIFAQFSTFRGYYVEITSLAPGAVGLPHSWPIIEALFRNAFFEDSWHLLGMLCLAALVLYPRQALSVPRSFLLLIILLQLACLFMLFRFSGIYQFIFNETLLNRLTFHFIPVILFYCAEVIGAGEALWRAPPPGTED